jgi:DNA-binding MarR family transcriptional regulator
MSRIVAGLARRGLAEIRADSQDARRVRILATAKGKLVLQKGRQLRIEYLATHLETLGAEELATLGSAIAILKRLLEGWL